MPEYQLPFQAELGLHPTFEEMTHMVSKNKARPLFPDVWKDSNQVGVMSSVSPASRFRFIIGITPSKPWYMQNFTIV